MIYGKRKAVLIQGQGFGEHALISKDNPLRTATCICLTNVVCIIVRKSNFQLIRDAMSQELDDKYNFIKQNMPGMNNVHSSALFEEIMYRFKKFQLNKGYDITLEA